MNSFTYQNSTLALTLEAFLDHAYVVPSHSLPSAILYLQRVPLLCLSPWAACCPVAHMGSGS